MSVELLAREQSQVAVIEALVRAEMAEKRVRELKA